jgi:hypothetical protein
VARGFKTGLINLQRPIEDSQESVSQSVSQSERQKDRHQHVAVSTATPHAARARRRRQVPPSKYRTATPHHTKVTNHCRLCISVPPPSLTQEKKRKFNISKRKSRLESSWVSKHPLYVQDLRFVTGTSILESGDWFSGCESSRQPIADPRSWFARAETSATESLFSPA